MEITPERLELYLQFFRGRKDIYALKWEKGSKSGWSPAYKFNWNDFNAFRAQGGTIKDFENKELIPLNREAIQKHLEGEKKLGMYPLLDNHTSYFIAADFDKANWKEEAISFYHACKESGIAAYIERSSSGNGAHVWIFFGEPYPANKSRAIILELLRKALNHSLFEKEVSFDRLFPNQDFHGNNQGYGNLIALPLQGSLIKDGNTSFLNSETLKPALDQWQFLKQIQKVSYEQLDNLHENLCGSKADKQITLVLQKQFGDAKKTTSRQKKDPHLLTILIRHQIFLKKSELSAKLVHFLRDELNFLNSEYLLKKKLGKSVYQTEKYYKLIEEDTDLIMLPRGFLGDLIMFCGKQKIRYEVQDERQLFPETVFHSNIELRSYQESALGALEDKDFGVLVAPPGSGKTVMGLQIVAERKQPTLIIVHRKQLLDQWMDRIQSFLKIPKKEIGQIASSKKKVGKKITVAMIQSLGRMEDFSELSNRFGMILIDECHHVPAKTFRQIIKEFNSYYCPRPVVKTTGFKPESFQLILKG